MSFLETLHQTELHWMESLQAMRTPVGDFLFRLLDFFDSELFSFFILPIVWFGWQRKWGIRMAGALLLSTLLNYDLKMLGGQPRPIDFFPEFALVDATGPGLPSGGAQSAVVIFGMLAMLSTFRYRFWVAGFWILLISFSRVYLGVHFPSDVLGGWCVGLLVLLAVVKWVPKIERWSTEKLLTWGLTLPCLLMLPFFSRTTVKLAATGFAIPLGLLWLAQSGIPARDPLELSKRILRPFIAILGLFIILAIYQGCAKWLNLHQWSSSAIGPIPLMLGYLSLGFWLSMGATMAISWLERHFLAQK